MTTKLTNWIGGGPSASLGGEYLDNLNPRNGERIHLLPNSTADDVEAAVHAAQMCFAQGGGGNGGAGGLSREERADLLQNVADDVAQHLEEFAEAEALDSGKPIENTRGGGIPRGIDNLRFFARALTTERTDAFTMEDGLNYVLRRPLGVVGLITPWNFPFHLLTWKLAPAIAMGNAVVAKPSELTPATASLLAESFARCGAPGGLFNVVHGAGMPAGDALVRHPDVKAVSFTGGTSTGRQIAAAGAQGLKKVGLELGGKNPTLLFADCDLDEAVEGAARAAFFNSGQVCLCGSRLLVEASIMDAVLERLKDFAEQWKANLGPLISQPHREKVALCVQGALADGAEILTGGNFFGPEEGAFYEPTILTGLSPTCPSARVEIFGPVVSVHPFEHDAEALALANDSEYGLASSVWTRDVRRAHHFAEHLEAGMVWVNSWNQRDLRVPFGGMKESGVGREGGRWSMEFFSQDRNVFIAS